MYFGYILDTFNWYCLNFLTLNIGINYYVGEGLINVKVLLKVYKFKSYPAEID